MKNLTKGPRTVRAMRIKGTVAAILLLGLVAAWSPAEGAEASPLVGHWEGALVVVPAELEMDVVVDFQLVGEEVRGDLSFPITADGLHPVENLVLKAADVSFSVRDKDGVVSAFAGVVSPDGGSLAGTMSEGNNTMAFQLRRVEARQARQAVGYRIGGDGARLKEAFNADRGKTRLLALPKVGSFSSRIALRLIERYVLERIESPDLKVYVVWVVPNLPTVEDALRTDMALAADPRVTHFWTTDRSLLSLLEPMLSPYGPVSNPCFLFAPDRAWAESAPLPDRVRQSAKPGPPSPMSPGLKLNGLDLAADVRLLLASRKSASGSP